jgi:hypothetical protein
MSLSRTTGNVVDIPFQLRASDIVKHVVNIDSRFGEKKEDSISDFYFRLLTPIKNILRIRIVSTELPNNYYFFTKKRKNISFRITYGVSSVILFQIVEGNYSATEMVDELTAILSEAAITWLSVSFNSINGKFLFTASGAGAVPFTIDTAYESLDRPFDYGLGYYLGFSAPSTFASTSPSAGVYIVESDECADFAGDKYVFLKVNDFNCVRQTTKENDFYALSKIILNEQKNFIVYDNYASLHAKEVVFPTPIDLTRLHVQFLDSYGALLEFCSTSFISFSIEILEVRNLSLYNAIRDSITLQYV